MSFPEGAADTAGVCSSPRQQPEPPRLHLGCTVQCLLGCHSMPPSPRSNLRTFSSPPENPQTHSLLCPPFRHQATTNSLSLRIPCISVCTLGSACGFLGRLGGRAVLASVNVGHLPIYSDLPRFPSRTARAFQYRGLALLSLTPFAVSGGVVTRAALCPPRPVHLLWQFPGAHTAPSV